LSNLKKPIYAIVGPTASGKAEIGMNWLCALAARLSIADSVQIYKEIEIATAKVCARKCAGCRII
jgi:tRNA dimethylallyltransferase